MSTPPLESAGYTTFKLIGYYNRNFMNIFSYMVTYKKAFMSLGTTKHNIVKRNALTALSITLTSFLLLGCDSPTGISNAKIETTTNTQSITATNTITDTHTNTKTETNLIVIQDTDLDNISNEKDICANTPINTQVNDQGCSVEQLKVLFPDNYKDTDNDSVTDNNDNCPSTPQNETADINGCSPQQLNPLLDSDNDGVANDQDNCPNSVGLVNDLGCALNQIDSDKDSVFDDKDKCLMTDSNLNVDINGCANNQLDDDLDLVNNHLDLCPMTNTDFSVNENGCANNQLDDDSDLITNDLDQCPTTNTGLAVNQSGCANNQLDDDTDLVNNDLDQCPMTNTGLTVDQNGCADNQLDDDQDSVFNINDQCPDTIDNVAVNNDGCSVLQLEAINNQNDDDSDGVTNNDDQCENTISNATVNNNGCSDLQLKLINDQLDDDNDGIKNINDQCPNTIETATNNGCSLEQLEALNPSTDVFTQFITAKENNTAFPFPDFSYAGYKKSEQGIPTPNWPIFDVTDYGATPNDNTDDLESIKLAITAAVKNQNGAIVFFPKGQYLVSERTGITSNLIKIKASNLILRGEGTGDNGTELFFKEHLDTTTPNNKWTTPQMISIEGSTTSYKGNAKTTIKSDAKIGDMQIELNNASSFSAGDYIILNLNDPTAANDTAIAPYTVEDNWSKFKTGEFQREMNQVKSKSGNIITLEAPIAMDINASYNWEARWMSLGTHFGMEEMTLRGNWKDSFSHHKDAVHDSGWGAISISKYADSWMKNVRLIDWNSTAHIASSIFSSFINVSYEGNRGHSSILVSGSYGILVSHSNDYSDKGAFHAQGVESYAAATVFHRIKWPQDTTFDSHASFPHATLFDRVDGGFSGTSGGNGGADASQPNHMENLVFWNFKDLGKNDNVLHDWWRTSSKYHRFYLPKMIGWHGAKAKFIDSQLGMNESYNSKVNPESLFEAQLMHRLGQLPQWLIDLNAEFGVTPNSPNTPVEAKTEYTINAGGNEFTTSDLTIFNNDNLFNNGSTYSNNNAITNTVDDALFQSERNGDFSYSLPVENGEYEITLYFAEIYFEEAGKRVFDVSVENTVLLNNYDIFSQAASKNKAQLETLNINITDSIINIDFISVENNAKLSAMSVKKVN